jgi:hypothetical protein
MYKDLNTPVWQLTVGELIELIANHTKVKQEGTELKQYDENIVYGLSGIANLFGVSKTMVLEYRKQGWIEPAISQIGRKIICDSRLALKLRREKCKDAVSNNN